MEPSTNAPATLNPYVSGVNEYDGIGQHCMHNGSVVVGTLVVLYKMFVKFDAFVGGKVGHGSTATNPLAVSNSS